MVFGGSYGIGADIATLAERLRRERLHVQPLQHQHPRRAPRDVAGGRRRSLEETGRIDFVVNTAGVLPRGDLLETSEETVFAATEVNYLAPIFIAQEFFPHLRKTQGSLLLFTSSSYTRGRAGYSLYSSAKAAVVNLTQALADEWAGAGVRVNCVNPERTATPMRTRAFGEEPTDSLLESMAVARASLDVLLSTRPGTSSTYARTTRSAARSTPPSWADRQLPSTTEATPEPARDRAQQGRGGHVAHQPVLDSRSRRLLGSSGLRAPHLLARLRGPGSAARAPCALDLVVRDRGRVDEEPFVLLGRRVQPSPYGVLVRAVTHPGELVPHRLGERLETLGHVEVVPGDPQPAQARVDELVDGVLVVALPGRR